MAKSNLLEIVRDILNDMDGDFVSSIFDTEESQQVAQIVKSTYQAIISNRNWPHTAKVVTLTPYSDNTLPTHMLVPSSVKEMISIFYDVRKATLDRLNYQEMKYIDPDSFLRKTNSRNSTDVNTTVIVDPSGVKFLISTNKAPEFYTSFDDSTIVFDSYNIDIDDTIQANKVQARAYTIPIFEMEDDFVPDLPDEAFTAFIEEAKSKAQAKLRQIQDVKAEQEANRQNRWLSRKAWKVHEKDIYPYSYGRKNAKGRRRDPTFRRD